MPTITVHTDAPCSLERAWTSWTTPADINRWNAASDDWHTARSSIDLRIDGRFSYRMEAKDGSVGFDFEGSFTQVQPQRLIEYVLDDGRKVSVAFEPLPNGVRVTQTFEADDTHAFELQKQGWQHILNRFASYLAVQDAPNTKTP